MTITNKPCPFCGETKYLKQEGDTVICDTCFGGDWNTRPIEDGLRAEIEKLKKQVDELIKAGNALSKVVKKAHWLCGEPEVGRWHNLTGKIKKERE